MLSQFCHQLPSLPQNKLCITSIPDIPQRLPVLNKVLKNQPQLSQPVSVRPSCQWAHKFMLTCWRTNVNSTELTSGSSTLDGLEEDTESERESLFKIPETSSTLFMMVESTTLNSILCQFSTFLIQRLSKVSILKFLTQSTLGKIKKNTTPLLEKSLVCSTKTSRNTTTLPQMLSSLVPHNCDDD